jgi:hypothetical protein
MARRLSFKTVIPVAGAFLLLQGIVEIVRCIICIKQGEWPSREIDVEEVDVDKLKEMVHVKDEDIEQLDKFVVTRGRANEEGTLVRLHIDGATHRGLRLHVGECADHHQRRHAGLLMLRLVVAAIWPASPLPSR